MNEDFKQSGLREDEYCRRKGFNYRWFERLNRDAERYEQKHIADSKGYWTAIPKINGRGFLNYVDSDSENKWTVFRGFRNGCTLKSGTSVQIKPESVSRYHRNNYPDYSGIGAVENFTLAPVFGEEPELNRENW